MMDIVNIPPTQLPPHVYELQRSCAKMPLSYDEIPGHREMISLYNICSQSMIGQVFFFVFFTLVTVSAALASIQLFAVCPFHLHKIFCMQIICTAYTHETVKQGFADQI